MTKYQPLRQIILAAPRGPCAGVTRAIATVEQALEKYGAPIFINHQIVHNKYVVADLEAKGVIFTSKVDKLPENAVYIFSAHGVSPQFRQQVAERKDLKVIDATCPLVTKVHLAVKKYTQAGFRIFYIGHRGHPEAEGVQGVAKIELIENLADVEKSTIKINPAVVLSQTTLSLTDTENIITALKTKFTQLKIPHSKDICYATTNRQTAVTKLAKQADKIIIVGSKNSSNANRLLEVGRRHKPTILVDNFKEIPQDFFNDCCILGISSAASVPEPIVQQLLSDLQQAAKKTINQELLITKQENMFFPLPQI